jgi:hypothetical protein
MRGAGRELSGTWVGGPGGLYPEGGVTAGEKAVESRLGSRFFRRKTERYGV